MISYSHYKTTYQKIVQLVELPNWSKDWGCGKNIIFSNHSAKLISIKSTLERSIFKG